MNFLRSVFRRRFEGLLYHYTTANGLLGILREKRIWATSSLHLNDGSELQYARDLLRKQLEQRENTFPRTSDTKRLRHWESLLSGDEPAIAFVTSFSENPNQLSQWRAYCPLGDGYSLGFSMSDLDYLIRKSGFALGMVQCIYDSAEQVAFLQRLITFADGAWARADRLGRKAFFGGFSLSLTTSVLVTMALAAIKHPSFQEEREWRVIGGLRDDVIKFRTGRFGAVPYFAPPLCASDGKPTLTELYIGPNANVTAAKTAAGWLCEEYLGNVPSGLDQRGVRIFDCGIPYRN
jgi:hypothetical protein